jgi:tRNA A-37 threonylcarbamoyl transferase component Bud32
MECARRMFTWSPLVDAAIWSEWAASIGHRLDAAAPTDLLHQGRNRVIVVPGPQGDQVVVKHFRPRGLRRLLYRFRASKAERAYRNAEALLRLGLPTPEPIGWGEERRGGGLEQAWLVTRRVPATWNGHHLHDSALGERGREMLAAVGALVARMHQAGVEHRDLTGGNLLISARDGGWRIEIIDINRMRLGRRLGRLASMANLVQLGYAGPQRLTVLDAYAGVRGWPLASCLATYDRLLVMHRCTWAIKHGTRPWRRRIGL